MFPSGTTACRTCQRQLTVSCVNCLRRAAEDSGAEGDEGEDSRGDAGGDDPRTTLWKLILEASSKEKEGEAKVSLFSGLSIPSALLLILSASRFLAPDSPLLVPLPFRSSGHLHGMIFQFFCLSLDSFKCNLRTFLFPNYYYSPALFSESDRPEVTLCG